MHNKAEAKMADCLECEALVWKRDKVMRYTGRTPSGFERQWVETQCKRLAKATGLCMQHLKIAERAMKRRAS